jgi:hypothetical protein
VVVTTAMLHRRGSAGLPPGAGTRSGASRAPPAPRPRCSPRKSRTHAPLSFGDLYGSYGSSWRVAPAASLLAACGDKVERGVPNKPSPRAASTRRPVTAPGQSARRPASSRAHCSTPARSTSRFSESKRRPCTSAHLLRSPSGTGSNQAATWLVKASQVAAGKVSSRPTRSVQKCFVGFIRAARWDRSGRCGSSCPPRSATGRPVGREPGLGCRCSYRKGSGRERRTSGDGWPESHAA